MTAWGEIHLVDLLTGDLGEPKKSGRQLFWRCPFHDDRIPSLTVTPDESHWKCFGCGRSGDGIDWVREREGLSFPDAVARLKGCLSQLPNPVAEFGGLPHTKQCPLPDAQWQAQVEEVVTACADELGRPAGVKACRWLAARGIEPETLLRWRIGHNPRSRRIRGLWVEQGVTIPWLHRERVEAIVVRRFGVEPKYKLISGSRRRDLYLGDTFRPGLPALLVEGEFDALLGWQEFRDLVNVGTLGSATRHPDHQAIWRLLGSPVILVAYDRDEAGAKGAGVWYALTSRVRTIGVPVGKDLTDFFQNGGDVRAWIEAELAAVHPRQQVKLNS